MKRSVFLDFLQASAGQRQNAQKKVKSVEAVAGTVKRSRGGHGMLEIRALQRRMP